jgi:penicillin amidase
MDEGTRQVLKAYSEGVNAYINSHSNSLGLEFQLLSLIGNDFTPETWTPVDTIAWSKMMAWDLGGNMGYELLRARIYSQLGEKGLEDFTPSYPDEHPLIIPNPFSEAFSTPILAEKVQGYTFGDGEGVGVGGSVYRRTRRTIEDEYTLYTTWSYY